MDAKVRKTRLRPPVETLFHRFQEVSGLGALEAGAAIGLSPDMVTARRSGKVEMSYTEELAIAAYLAGLPPFAEDTVDEILNAREPDAFNKKGASALKELRRLKREIDSALRKIEASSRDETSAS